jgi:acylphosphatase
MAQTTKRFVISGRVQGVSFRAYTKFEAQKLGLTGWVRNLSNGDVEVLACGDAAAVDRLHEWLHRGPPLGKVLHVQSEAVAEETSLAGFEIHTTNSDTS